MSLQETATYTVDITLSTRQGELPTLKETQSLIESQMEGELDEEGLKCIAVQVREVG